MIITGDCRDELRRLEANSVHCVVTSPPYYGLRDYKIEPSVWGGDPACEHEWGDDIRAPWANDIPGPASGGKNEGRRVQTKTAGSFCQCGAWLGVLGLEPTWQLFVEHTVEVFREVRRVLRKDGTLWLNVGDTYASGSTKSDVDLSAGTRKGANLAAWSKDNARGGGHKAAEVNKGWAARPEFGATSMKRKRAQRDGTHVGKHESMAAFGPMAQPNRESQPGFKPKDRMMIPARVAIALCDDGWWLRDEVVWHKPNPMPSSVDDRTTPAHEMLYLLTKSARYFYDADAIAEPANYAGQTGYFAGGGIASARALNKKPSGNETPGAGRVPIADTRNRRSVWTIATMPFPEAHFATFPPDLVEPCVKAGTSDRGCCVKCAAPWERVTTEVESGRVQKMPAGMATKAGDHDVVDHNKEGREVAPSGNPVMTTVTVGWWPSCACDQLEPLEPLPEKPSRARIADEAVYKIAAAAWREACVPVVNGWRSRCLAAANLPVKPAVVLDPFGGAGTVGLVADRLQRDYVLIDRGPDYVAMARRRIAGDSPLFSRAAE